MWEFRIENWELLEDLLEVELKFASILKKLDAFFETLPYEEFEEELYTFINNTIQVADEDLD